MHEIINMLFQPTFQIIGIAFATAALLLTTRIFYQMNDSSKTQRQAKDELFKIFDVAIGKSGLFNINYLRTVKNSTERKHEVSFIFTNLLEDYLVYINSKKEKDDSADVDAAYQIIKPIIDAENEEMPFEKLPENERRLLTNLKNNIESEDKQATSFNLNELCSVISLNNKSYLREKTLNRWSVPLAIFGLVFTLIFGITGLFNKPDSSELVKSLSHTIDSKVGTVESKIDKYFLMENFIATDNNGSKKSTENDKSHNKANSADAKSRATD